MQNTKKRYIILILSVLIFSLLSALYMYLTLPVKIGIIFSPDSTLGNESNLAARFFLEKNPRIAFRPVRFLIKNPSLEKTELVRAYRELEKEGVSLILGGAISKSGVVMAEEAERSGIPTFGNTASSEMLSGKKDHFYRIVMSTDQQTKGMIPYFVEKGFSRLALLLSESNSEFSSSMANSIEKYHSGPLLRLKYDESPDLPEKILAFEADALYCILPGNEMIRLISAIRNEPEFDTLPVVSSEWAFSIFPYYSDSLLEGVMITSQHGRPTPAYQKMIEEFRTVYRQPTFYSSEYTFSILNIIYETIREIGDKREKLREFFAQPRVYDYVYGKVFMDEFGDALHDMTYIYEMKEGKMLQISRIPVPDYPK